MIGTELTVSLVAAWFIGGLGAAMDRSRFETVVAAILFAMFVSPQIVRWLQ